MTAAEKKRYLYKWDRFQKRHERIYTTKFKAALREQVQQYAKTGNINSGPIYSVLLDLYKTVGPLWAAATGVHRMKLEKKARMPMGFNERIVELMRRYYNIDLLNDAEQMTTYTREVISAYLSKAAIEGTPINDIVRYLESHTELGAMRARRIARTETVTAANGAAIINAKEHGLPMRKIWLAIDDKRTRHSHRNVDDHTADIDTPFTVGGVKMMQPGARQQPNGLPVPASEVVNCRCTLGFEVID